MFIYCIIISYTSLSQAHNVDLKLTRILSYILHQKEIMTVLWKRSARWVSKYSSKVFQRSVSVPVYRRTPLPTFHECHDLLTQVSLKVFEIIRRPSRRRPVTIHEAVTTVRQEINPERNPRPSGNPRKRHGEINNRRNATYRHVNARIYISRDLYSERSVFLRTNS